MPRIIYNENDFGLRDYPRGRYEGAVSVRRMKNAMKRRGYELVNASSRRRNGVLEGSSGFILDPASGRLVYFSADASFSDKVLYRTAKDGTDCHGGVNRYADFESLGEAVADLFAHPERWD